MHIAFTTEQQAFRDEPQTGPPVDFRRVAVHGIIRGATQPSQLDRPLAGQLAYKHLETSRST